ncbi:uncharacterized protein LOC100678382 [Nasonia vitripennis]|uniref:CFA20 domain-containing protein n=1 Tax=Nasonia vitripennis TaxID=7425 RepID=A0A7M7LNP3_NASVI|nr:uncharacterized protein LOC100678382 [Nasonia vitripennis]
MQGGYLSLLYSTSNKPLEYWSKQKSRTGSIKKVLDEELNENVLEIQDIEDSNCQKTWIMSPPDSNQILNIKLPFLVIVLKSVSTQCFFQLQMVDKDNIRHLINFSNVEGKKSSAKSGKISKVSPPRMQLFLEPGWNRLEIDLCHLSKIFEAQFEAVNRLKICAGCRIRRIYFTDRHYEDEEMPLSLYQGFLDLYMLKWGIKEVERATQTKKTTGKPTTTKDNAYSPGLGLNKLFLKNLQAKSDQVIEEFFSKQSVKSVKDYLDFKKKAKIKPYVIPDNSKSFHVKNVKSSDASLVDFNEIKSNFLRESSLLGKLAFEDQVNRKGKVKESKSAKPEVKYSPYKIHKYRYPMLLERKTNTKSIEMLSKPIVSKNSNAQMKL